MGLWGCVLFCCGGLSCARGDVSSTPHTPKDQPKMSPDITQCPPGGTSPLSSPIWGIHKASGTNGVTGRLPWQRITFAPELLQVSRASVLNAVTFWLSKGFQVSAISNSTFDLFKKMLPFPSKSRETYCFSAKGLLHLPDQAQGQWGGGGAAAGSVRSSPVTTSAPARRLHPKCHCLP